MGLIAVVFIALNAVSFDYANCTAPVDAGKDVPAYCGK